jgi:hypothetical protein
MHPDELARLVDRELKRLPAPKAPDTLLPRVMAAVRALPSAAPTSRWWLNWPVAAQGVSAAIAIALVVGLWRLWPAAQAQLVALMSAVSWGPVGRLAAILRDAESLGTAIEVVWRVVMQPIGWVMLPVVLLMWIACAMFGAALSRVALGGATQS